MATKQKNFDSVYSQVATVQKNHINNNGRYWQGIPVPVDIPTTGDDPAIDTTVKPDDQSESWAGKSITLPEPCDLQFSVQEWENGEGNVGWLLVAMYYDSNGKLKKKAKDYKGNESAWFTVQKPDDPLA